MQESASTASRSPLRAGMPHTQPRRHYHGGYRGGIWVAGGPEAGSLPPLEQPACVRTDPRPIRLLGYGAVAAGWRAANAGAPARPPPPAPLNHRHPVDRATRCGTCRGNNASGRSIARLKENVIFVTAGTTGLDWMMGQLRIQAIPKPSSAAGAHTNHQPTNQPTTPYRL